MNKVVVVNLKTSIKQFNSLRALQSVFATACNAITPEVQRSRNWNRVVLHHMHYRSLRNKYPDLGSQMVCNVIYAVSRTCRLLFQSDDSPFALSKLGNKPLPLLKFSNNCPVYFDRHTLSVGEDRLNLFTLEGRLKFDLTLSKDLILLFETSKIKEITLKLSSDANFKLVFCLEAKIIEESLMLFVGEKFTEDLSITPRPIVPEYISLELAE